VSGLTVAGRVDGRSVDGQLESPRTRISSGPARVMWNHHRGALGLGPLGCGWAPVTAWRHGMPCGPFQASGAGDPAGPLAILRAWPIDHDAQPGGEGVFHVEARPLRRYDRTVQLSPDGVGAAGRSGLVVRRHRARSGRRDANPPPADAPA
jgi:hypothetical protein